MTGTSLPGTPEFNYTAGTSVLTPLAWARGDTNTARLIPPVHPRVGAIFDHPPCRHYIAESNF